MGRSHNRLVKYAFGIFVLIVLVYAYFEAQNILYGPQITLANEDGAITVQTSRIEISGSTKNVVDISLDGRSLIVDDTGVFTEEILLAEGLNRFTFMARDKFGRVKKERLEVVYQPQVPLEQRPSETGTMEDILKE